MLGALAAFAGLFDVLPDAVVVVDRAGRVVLANGAGDRVLGYRPDELVGGPLDPLLPPRHRERHRRQVAGFQAGGQARAMSKRPLLHALD